MNVSIVAVPLIALLATAAGQSSWANLTTDHFDVYYRVRQNDGGISAIANDAERAYAQVSFDLGRQLADKVTLIIVRTKDDGNAVKEIVGPDGSSDRRQLILPIASIDPHVVLLHELTHQFELQLIGSVGDTPVWASEGLADHEADAWSPADVSAVRVALAGGSIPEVGHFAASDRVWGHALFDFVATEYGLRGLRQYVAALHSSAFAGDSAPAVFGMTVDDFDWEFKMFVVSRF